MKCHAPHAYRVEIGVGKYVDAFGIQALLVSGGEQN